MTRVIPHRVMWLNIRTSISLLDPVTLPANRAYMRHRCNSKLGSKPKCTAHWDKIPSGHFFPGKIPLYKWDLLLGFIRTAPKINHSNSAAEHKVLFTDPVKFPFDWGISIHPKITCSYKHKVPINYNQTQNIQVSNSKTRPCWLINCSPFTTVSKHWGTEDQSCLILIQFQ